MTAHSAIVSGSIPSNQRETNPTARTVWKLRWVQVLLVGLVCIRAAAADDSSIKSAQNRWHDLLQRNPYPYTTPIPADHPTAVDGVYVKFETQETPPVPCRRCPDYKPEGGWWKVSLRNGVFRIFHPVSGWRSLATYSVVGGRVLLSNDPVCPGLTGVYRWVRTGEHITFSTVEDKCSAGLRARNLSHLPWQSCNPPLTDAAVGDRRPSPAGCNQQ